MVFGTARAVKSHRTGRRRKKGGSRLPVAPWIVITLVCVLVASGLTWGFMTLLRSGCSGSVFRVTVAAAPTIAGAVEDAAQDWEATQPQVDGECVGVSVTEVTAAQASRGITGVWDQKSLGAPPIAWVPDSQAWASWVTSSEATAGYVSTDPVVLGQATSVVAVAESKAEELGWLGGQPPSWPEILDAAAAGEVSLAAANPRTSTEGLVAMLNASSDGEGGFSEEAMAAYAAAIDAGSIADDAPEQFAGYVETGDTTQIYTALGYQVEDFNAINGVEDPLVPITPAGTSLGAVATYLVLGGAGWVSESDAGIAAQFGAFLADAVAAGDFTDPELSAVDDASTALALATPEAVGLAVRSWRSGSKDLNVLFLVDRSVLTEEETVEYGGEAMPAATAAIRLAVSMVEDMESTYRVGLWEFGRGAGEDRNWRSVTDIAELTDDNRANLVADLYAIWENDTYQGGSPLYDSLVAAYEHMGQQSVADSANMVVVLTNVGTDVESQPTVEQTADTIAGLDGAVTVYTIGLGSADDANLTLLAEAGGGAYLDSPDAATALATITG